MIDLSCAQCLRQNLYLKFEQNQLCPVLRVHTQCALDYYRYSGQLRSFTEPLLASLLVLVVLMPVVVSYLALA